jgi:hypothetical protein
MSGGAGTTAAGLRYGLPTFVCPFFADQFMWGAMVKRAGVGPTPCPVHKLTAATLAMKLEELNDEEVRKKAKLLSVSMSHENGVQGGLRHFLDSLPRDSMLCDVCLLLGETKLATHQIQVSQVKISLEVAATLRDQPLRRPKTGTDFLVNILISANVILNWFNPIQLTRHKRHAICTYALGRVHTCSQGMMAGWFGFLREIFRGLFEIYIKSDKFARSHGAFGCLFGLILVPFYILYDLLRGLVIFLDRILVGISNGCFGRDELFLIDPTVQARVYQTTANMNELLNYDPPSDSRREQLKYAVRLANNASHVFFLCKPKFPHGHWHWLEVERKDLKATMIRSGKDRLLLKDEEYDILMNSLDTCSLENVSFSRFCLFLGWAVKKRLGRLHRASVRVSPEFNTSMSLLSPSGHAITPIGVIDDDDDDKWEKTLLQAKILNKFKGAQKGAQTRKSDVWRSGVVEGDEEADTAVNLPQRFLNRSVPRSISV